MDTVETKKQNGNTVKLRTPTFNRLQTLKHKGQSNDGFITELLDLYENDLPKNKVVQSPKQARDMDDNA